MGPPGLTRGLGRRSSQVSTLEDEEPLTDPPLAYGSEPLDAATLRGVMDIGEALSWIKWGDAPAWFSSIGTVGTLLLGLRILLRDRRKDEQSQAAQIACWEESTSSGDYAAVPLHVFNGSALPIRHPRFYAILVDQARTARRVHAIESELDEEFASNDSQYAVEQPLVNESGATCHTVSPGQRLSHVLRLARMKESYDVYLMFVDAAGVGWLRNARTGTLVKGDFLEDHPYADDIIPA